MLFSTTNLFKSIPCPQQGNCKLTNCIYSHEPQQPSSSSTPPPNAQATTAPPPPSSDAVEPAAKRRKITYDSLADKPPSKADIIRSQLAAAKSSSSQTRPSASPAQAQTSPRGSSQPPRSLVKPVSPPQTSGRAAPPSQTAGKSVPPSNSAAANNLEQPKSSAPPETLNPRLIPSDPVGHAKRALFLKHLHAEMVRVNQQLGNMHVLYLNEQELIKLSLDEEEKIVREQPKVYPNVIKHRISALKKMTAEEWVMQAKVFRQSQNPQTSSDKKKKKVDAEIPIVTGLPLHQEPLILPHLAVIDQPTLRPFGYITTPPTAEEAREAALAATTNEFETCDRCTHKFTVFQDRNGDTGEVTSNGICIYHGKRPIQPPTKKGEAPRSKMHPCCGGEINSKGCKESKDHVFLTKSPARLAAVCPFIVTPENSNLRKSPSGKGVQAVVFDCEMGYTSFGFECIRLTAMSWPEGEQLVDVLVRPLGIVIDLNQEYSGVKPEHYTDGSIKVVEGPAEARKLLCEYLTPTTPLMGHAIENDLSTIRLCHPTIVDTVLLFPLHGKSLPYRHSLKTLSQKHLRRTIQAGVGHDSKEDAVATGDLVRVKVGEQWKAMRIKGWKIVDGKLVEPEKPETPEEASKRKLGEFLEADSGGEEAK